MLKKSLIKIIGFLLAQVLLFTACACSGKNTESSDISVLSNISELSDYQHYDSFESDVSEQNSNSLQNSNLFPAEETIELKQFTGLVIQHTLSQQGYLNGPYNNIGNFAGGKAELSKPAPVILSWKFNNPNNRILTNYTVYVGEKSDLSDAKQYETADSQFLLYNLKLGTTYYWNVSALYDGGSCYGTVNSFTTDTTAPRNIAVDGVTNMRDLGGWEIDGGGRIKQGMLYRCGRLNTGGTDDTIEITLDGVDVMLNDLGIRSEIDLRTTNDHSTGDITESVIDPDLNYYSCPMSYKGNILTENKEMIGKVFKLLADESNYPLIFHCNIGTDRTGAISFLVEGLLGASEDALYRDYLFSNYGNIGGSRSSGTITTYIETVKAYGGSSLSESCYLYLRDAAGVLESEINSIISLLTE